MLDLLLLPITAVGGLLVMVFVYLIGTKESKYGPKFVPTSRNIPTHPKLKEHTKTFEKRIIQIADNVHVAIGYGLANCILIEGEDCSILIDTLECDDAALEVKAAFQEITSKPIKAIIVTHFHPDHANGIGSFLDHNPDVIAHESTRKYLDQVANVRALITYSRGMKQFGSLLGEGMYENSGIGGNLRFGPNNTFKLFHPSKTVQDVLKVSYGGIDLELIHAPGETPDQIIVWWPEKRILFPADNIYRSFPNMYAIRGTMTRDPLLWIAALDRMLELNPEILVPQHTLPLVGTDKVRSTLIHYRDGIQFVHDQTLHWMNQGYDDVETAHKVNQSFPKALRDHDYLQEFYGTIQWSSKAVYHHYLGWYSGILSTLIPWSSIDKATHVIQALGGEEEAFKQARTIFERGQYQTSLEVCDILLDSGWVWMNKARALKIECLEKLGEEAKSANARNWYLTSILELEGLELKPQKEQVQLQVQSLQFMADLFKFFEVRILPEKTSDTHFVAHFHFKDTNERIQIEVKYGTASVIALSEEPKIEADLRVRTTTKVWKSLLCKEAHPLFIFLTKDISIRPSIFKLNTFMSFFDVPN